MSQEAFWQGDVTFRKDAPLSQFLDMLDEIWGHHYEDARAIPYRRGYYLEYTGNGFSYSFSLDNNGNLAFAYSIETWDLNGQSISDLDDTLDYMAKFSLECWVSIEGPDRDEIVRGPSVPACRVFQYELALLKLMRAIGALTISPGLLGNVTPDEYAQMINRTNEKYLWQIPSAPGASSVLHTWQSLREQLPLLDVPQVPAIPMTPVSQGK